MRGSAATIICLAATSAWAAPSCQDFAAANILPPSFKIVTASAVGPAQLVIMSDGRCTCNNVPSMQRHLGQSEPDGVNWACAAADADPTKAN